MRKDGSVSKNVVDSAGKAGEERISIVLAVLLLNRFVITSFVERN